MILIQLESLLDYDAFANALREIDAMEEVLVTVWQGVSFHRWICNTNVLLKLEDQRLGIGFARMFNVSSYDISLSTDNEQGAQMLDPPDLNLTIPMRVRRAHCGTTSGILSSVQQQTAAKR